MIAKTYKDGFDVRAGDTVEIGASKYTVVPDSMFEDVYPNGVRGVNPWVPVADSGGHINGYDPENVTLIHRAGFRLDWPQVVVGDLVKLVNGNNEEHQFVAVDSYIDARGWTLMSANGSYGQEEGWVIVRHIGNLDPEPF